MDLKTVVSNLKDSKTVTEFVKVIATWFFDFGWITAGKNINIQKSSSGIVISGRDTPPSGSGDNNPTFAPFALSFVAGSNVVTVGASRGTYGSGFITLGLSRNIFSVGDNITISSSVYIYYKVTTATAVTLEINSLLPVQDNNNLYFLIGQIIWDNVNNKIDSVISYYPYGNIHYPARFL